MALIIARLQQNIEEKVQQLSKTKYDLEEKVKIVEGLEKSTIAAISGSASTAQERRQVRTLSLKESLQQYKDQIRAYQDTITVLENEISQYEEQKREWEKKYGYMAI